MSSSDDDKKEDTSEPVLASLQENLGGNDDQHGANNDQDEHDEDELHEVDLLRDIPPPIIPLASTTATRSGASQDPVSIYAANMRQNYLTESDTSGLDSSGTSFRPSDVLRRRLQRLGHQENKDGELDRDDEDVENMQDRHQNLRRVGLAVYEKYNQEPQPVAELESDIESREGVGKKDKKLRNEKKSGKKKRGKQLDDLNLSETDMAANYSYLSAEERERKLEQALELEPEIGNDSKAKDAFYLDPKEEEEEEFVNRVDLPDSDIDAYGGKYGTSRSSLSAFLPSGMDLPSWLKEWTRTKTKNAITAKGKNSPSPVEQEQSNVVESKMDDIINGVPAKYIQNSDKGLLCLLSPETKSSDDIESMDYLDIGHPVEKKRKLLRTLMGPAYDNHDVDDLDEYDEKQEGRNEEEDPSELPKLPFGEVTQNKEKDLQTIQIVQDFLLALCQRKEEEEMFPERAWWLEGLGEAHMTAADIMKVDIDSKRIPQSAKRRTGESYEKHNETDAWSENSDSGVDELKLLEDEDKIDWDERLWEVARRYYQKAYHGPDLDQLDHHEPISDDDAMRSRQVIEFRSQMIVCLEVYIHVFYNHELSPLSSKIVDADTKPREADGHENDVQNHLRVPSFVPIDIAKELFREIIKRGMQSGSGGVLEDKEKFTTLEETDEYVSSVRDDGGSIFSYVLPMHINPNIYAAALCDALLGSELNCYDHFEVQLLKSTTDERSQSELKIDRKQVKTESVGMNDRSLVDEFVYDIKPEKKPAGEKNKSENSDGQFLEKEVRLQSSIKRHILLHHSGLRTFTKRYDDVMAKLMSNLIGGTSTLQFSKEGAGQGGKREGERTNEPGKTILRPNLSLSLVYAFKHCVSFFLIRHLKKDELLKGGDGDIGDDDEALTLNISNPIYQLMLESSFIRRRAQIFGPYIATKDHIRDWLSLSALNQSIHFDQSPRSILSENVDQRMYFNSRSRENYSLIHKKLVSELKYILDNVVTDAEEAEVNRSSEKPDLLSEDICAPRLSRYAENACKFIEIGRSAHNLGLDLGRSEKGFGLDLNEDGMFIDENYSEIEMADYKFAVSSLREAASTLMSCRQIIDSINSDLLPGEPRKFKRQFEQVRDLSISVDLYLADTLVAMGFCCDLKFADHKKAMSHYREALKLYRHLGGNHAVVINALQNLGSVLFDARNYNDALNCFKQRLRLLRNQEKEGKKQKMKRNDATVEGNARHLDKMKVQENICVTLQSKARAYVQLREHDLAIRDYAESITRMRNMKGRLSSNRESGMNPTDFLDESLLELSELYIEQATRMFDEWTKWGLTFMFGPIQKPNTTAVGINYSSVVKTERKASNSLNESIHNRLGLLHKMQGNGDGYDYTQLLDGLASIPQKELDDFRCTLMRNGLLKIRHRQYESARLDLTFVLQLHLQRPSNLSEDEPSIPFLLEMIPANFGDTSQEYKTLPLLICMGNLCIRLENFEHAMSFYDLCLQMCNKKLSTTFATPREKVGIKMDLADIHRSLGFVHLQRQQHKIAATHLRTASRLLDSIISDPSENLTSEVEEFVLEVHVKVSIVKVLNLLGRVYYEKDETLEKGLVCFEDSMIILEDVLDEFKQDSGLFSHMLFIQKVANGSLLQKPISLLSLGKVLGDNYYRGGKIYMKKLLHVDAELAFHRAISILEDLKEDSFLQHDDENEIQALQTNDLNTFLLDACKSALSLLELKHGPSPRLYMDVDGKIVDPEMPDEDDGLSYSAEDLLFRIGNCYGELSDFDKALPYLYKARQMTEELLGRDNLIVASILHNIGTVQRSRFLASSSEDARYESIYAFQEAVIISKGCQEQNDLFVADSMYREVEMKMAQSSWSSSEAISLGNDDELLQYLESALEIRLRYHGELHADVSLTRYLLGKCYYYRRDIQKALHHFDKALSQWTNLFHSVNLDIFDAIYFRGLCHLEAASSIIKNDQLRQRELDEAAKFFLEAMHHSNDFSSAISAKSSISYSTCRTCLIHSIRCALQVTIIRGKQEDERYYLRHYKSIISTAHYTTAFFYGEKCPESTFLSELAAKAWLRVAAVKKQSVGSVGAVRALETALGLYSSLSIDEEFTYLLDRAVISILLAKEYKVNLDEQKSLRMYEETAVYMGKLGKMESSEAAGILVYTGALSEAYAASTYFKEALLIFKKVQSTVDKPNHLLPGIGQKGILYKILAHKDHAKGKNDTALGNISTSILIIEKVRKFAKTPQIRPESLEDALLQTEDWDVVLLECYAMSLQIAFCVLKDNELKTYAGKIFNQIALLLGEIGNFSESFQGFYSLLLYTRGTFGDNDANVANLLFNMSQLSVDPEIKISSVPFHEEFFRITSVVLGSSLSLLPSVITLSVEMYEHREYETAMKWADVGLTSLRDTTAFELEAAKLIAVKAKSLTELGKLATAKRLLEKSLEGMNSRTLPMSEIRKVLGQIYHKNSDVNKARTQYYKSLEIRQDFAGSADIAEIKCAVGELFAENGYGDTGRKFCEDALLATTVQYNCDHVAVAHTLFSLAKVLIQREAKLAQRYLKESVRIYKLNALPNYLAAAIAHLGFSYKADNNLSAASDCLLEASNILYSEGGNVILHADVLRSIALIFYNLGDFESGAKYFERAIVLLRQTSGRKNNPLGETFYWYGRALNHTGDIDTSLKSLRASLKLLTKDYGDHANMIILAKLTQGENHLSQMKASEATSCAIEAARMIKETKNKLGTNELVSAYYFAGQLFQKLKMYEKSIENTKKALLVLHKKKKKQQFTHALDSRRQLVRLYCEVEEYSLAREHAISYSNEIAQLYGEGSPEMIQVHEMYGDIDFESGHGAAAIVHYEKACAMQDKASFSIGRCELLLKLAKCWVREKEWRSALLLLSEAEDSAVFVHGSDSCKVRIRLERAHVFYEQGRNVESMDIYVNLLGNFGRQKGEASALHDSDLGLTFTELVHMYTNIGTSLIGRREESLYYLTKGAQICSSDSFEDNLLSRKAISGLATALQTLIEQYQSVSHLGDDIKDLISLQFHLGNLFIRAYEFKSAVLVFEQLLNHQRRTDNRLQIPTTLHNLGSCYLELGNINVATSLLEDALQMGRAMLGHDHADVADTTYTLARAYTIASDIDSSISLLQESLRIRMHTYSMKSFQVIHTLHAMGQTLTAADRTEGALKIYSDVLSIQKNLPQQNARVLCNTTHFLIAQAFINEGSLELGLSHLKTYMKSPYKRSGGLQVDIATALYEIANIYGKRGETKQANKYYSRSMKEIEAQLGIAKCDKGVHSVEDKGQTSLHAYLLRAQSSSSNQLMKYADLVLLYGVLLKQRRRFVDSLKCLEVAHESFSRILNTNSLRIGEVLVHKGELFSQIGKHGDAAVLLRDALILREKKLGESARKVAEVMRLLGICESELGNNQRAMELLKQNATITNRITKQKRRGNNEDADTLFVVGKLYSEQNQLGSALDIYNRCLKTFRTINGDASRRSMLEVTIAVGHAFLRSGSYFRALMSFEQALYSAEGEGSSLVCDSLSSMGNLYSELGRYQDAIESFTRCLLLQQEIYSVDHQCTAQTLISLGAVYAKANQLTKSEEVYNRAIHVLIKQYGEYRDVGICWLRIGDLHMKRKSIDQALTCYEHALKIIRSIDEDDKNLVDAFYGIGICLLRQQRHQESIIALSEASTRSTKVGDEAKSSESLLHLAVAQFKIGYEDVALANFTKAIDVKVPKLGDETEAANVHQGIETALNILKKRSGSLNVKYADMIQKKGICLAIMSEYKSALYVHTSAMKIYKRIYGASHISVKNCLFNIALCLNSMEKPQKARICLRKAYQLTMKEFGEETLETADIQFHIGLTYKIEGDYRAAKKCFDDCISLRKLFSNDGKNIAEVYEMVGDTAIANSTILPLEIAEKYYLESLRLYMSAHCHEKKSAVDYKLANLYVMNRQYGKGINHFEKSLVATKVLTGSKDDLTPVIYLNLGIAHDSANNFSKAVYCFDKCLKSGGKISTEAFICKGRALSKVGRFEEALDSLSLALENNVRSQSTVEANVLVAKGQVLDLMNDNATAMKCYLSALSIYRKSPNEEEAISSTCQEIANSNLRHESFDAAFRYAEEAFEIRHSKFGMKHHLTAESLYCKGAIFFGKNEYEQSLSCLELALFNFKETGACNLLKANALYMIGCAQEKLGRCDQAFVSLTESLDFHRKKGQGDHIDVARTLRRLGTVHKERKEYPQSRSCLKESLRICIDRLGPRHLEVAQTYEYLAETLCRESRFDEAVYYANEAIEIHESYERSPALARCYGLKGIILDQGNKKLGDTIQSYKQSKEVYTFIFDDKNCSTENENEFMTFASIVFKLAMAQERNGMLSHAVTNYSRASKLYKEALNSSETLFVADVFEKLANLKGRQKKYEKACVLLEQTLRIRIKILGMEHESVAQALFSLGIIFCKQNEYDAALRAFTDCLSIRQLHIGFDAIETADTLHAIGQCLGNAEDYQNAVNVWNEAFEIYTKHENCTAKLTAVKRDLDLGYRLLEG